MVPALACLLALFGSPQTSRGAPLPDEAPRNLVWEGAPALSTAARWKLESLLLQHQHLTGERVLAILAPEASLPDLGELGRLSPKEAAARVFDHWSLETTARANQLLLFLKASGGRVVSGVHFGTGIGLDSDQKSALRDALDRLPEGPRESGTPWDAAVLMTAREVLAALQSPVLEQIEDARTLDGAIQSPKRSQPMSSGSPWVWVFITLALAGTVFYWTYEQILDQEVLIGPRRWVLFSPRLKLQLVLGRVPDGLRATQDGPRSGTGTPSFMGGSDG
jgi:hypothetical protein